MKPAALVATLVVAVTRVSAAAAEPVAAPPVFDAAAYVRAAIADRADRDRRARLTAGWSLMGAGIGVAAFGLLLTRAEDQPDQFLNLSDLAHVFGWSLIGAGALAVIGAPVAWLSRRPIERVRDELESAIARGDATGIDVARRRVATLAARDRTSRRRQRIAGYVFLAGGAAAIATGAVVRSRGDLNGILIGSGATALVGGGVLELLALRSSATERLDAQLGAPFAAGLAPIDGGAIALASGRF